MKKHLLFFFLDDFHHGAVNHVVHAIGFTVLGYGLGVKSLILILISPFIMELGHFYNFTRGVNREMAIKIIPLQWLAWVIFVGAGYMVSRLTSY